MRLLLLLACLLLFVACPAETPDLPPLFIVKANPGVGSGEWTISLDGVPIGVAYVGGIPMEFVVSPANTINEVYMVDWAGNEVGGPTQRLWIGVPGRYSIRLAAGVYSLVRLE